MFDDFRRMLQQGNPVVVSLRPLGQNVWHGYLIYGEENGDFLAITKTSPPNSNTRKSLLSSHLQSREKADCLFMTRPSDRTYG